MAEAIATLSLVCNVMQVVSFTGEVIQLYRAIPRDGCPEPSLASNLVHLSGLVTSLQGKTSEYDPVLSNIGDELGDVKALQQARTKLSDIASTLIKDTKKLQKLLEKVAAPGDAGKLGRLATVFKYKFYYETPISSLEKRINGTRDILNSELLSRTCSSIQASHCRSEERYLNLDDEIKKFIDHWSEGKRTISELILAEGQKTRTHVTTEAERIRGRIDLIDTRLLSEFSRRDIEGTRKRVLSTLWFPEMNQRENTITEATDDIVHEIFPKSKLADWLRSDQPVFWISGKPGSGKSTLTKYLTQSNQTIDYLKNQHPTVQALRFYFYELGNNNLQRQLLGCLRTLLHQILEDDLEILERLLQLQPGIGRKISEHDWSLKELFNSLAMCLRDRTTASCLFLDGLDEIHVHERVAIVDLVKSLGNIPKVKVCATSRPENIFTQHLGAYPSLRVQEITNLALYSYVERGLQGYTKCSGRSEKEYRTFFETIVQKSEGVFLWTVMVVNSLIRGVENGDSWELLQQRVAESAPGLNEMFKQIWNKHNLDLPAYKKEAAQIFRHTLNSVSIEEQQSFRHYLIATHQDFRGHLQQFIAAQDETAFVGGGADIIQQYAVWLSARSAGLLEIEEPKSLLSPVDFIHRSVQEFFEGTQDGKHILDHDDRSIESRQAAYNHATREITYIHITTVMFLAQTPANIKRPLAVKTLRMLGQRLCCIDGTGSEKYREWMPPLDPSRIWMQMVFHIGAIAGDVLLLDHMSQTDGILDHISQEEMSNILLSCCIQMGVNDVDGETFIKTTAEGENLKGSEGTIIITRRKLNCVEWLLNHGADPHTAREENYQASIVCQLIAKHATAFEIFILATVLSLFQYVGSGSQDPPSWVLVEECLTDLQRCIRAFSKYPSEDQHDVLLFSKGHRDIATTPSIQCSVRVARFLEILNRISTLDTPAERDTLIGHYDASELIQLRSVKGQNWTKLSCVEKSQIEDIRKLESLLTQALFGVRNHAEIIDTMALVIEQVNRADEGRITLRTQSPDI